MPRTKKIKNSGLVDTSQVPKEIWANILKLADLTIRDVRKVAIVCKRWNEICRSDAFWNTICVNSIPGYNEIQKKLNNASPIYIAKSVFQHKSNSKSAFCFCRICGSSSGEWCELCSSNLCSTCCYQEKYIYRSATDIKLIYGTNLTTLNDYPIRTTRQTRKMHCWGNPYDQEVTVYLVRDVADAIYSKRKGILERALKKHKLPVDCIKAKFLQDWMKNSSQGVRSATKIVEEFKKSFE